jgi:hypothetical protein
VSDCCKNSYGRRRIIADQERNSHYFWNRPSYYTEISSCGLWPNKFWRGLSTSQSNVNFSQNQQFDLSALDPWRHNRRDTHRLSINFPFRWFRFSLRTWATAALTELSVSMPEQSLSKPEQSLSRAWAEPEQSLSTIMWNPFWPPVCPGYSFLIEFCSGTGFCTLTEFLLEQFWIPLVKKQNSDYRFSSRACYWTYGQKACVSHGRARFPKSSL